MRWSGWNRWFSSAALLVAAWSPLGAAWAAPNSTAPAEGPRQNTPQVHALVGGRVIIEPGRALDAGTVLVRDGVIVDVGPQVVVPAEARVWNLSGKWLYPGFIDSYSELSGAPDVPPTYWNRHVRAEQRAADRYRADAETNKSYRGQGFALRLAAPGGGIIKGQSALVTTSDLLANHALVRERAALHLKLTPVITENREYPVSPMGAVALVRQAFYDAQWHGKAWEAFRTRAGTPRPETSAALDALHGYLTGSEPVVVDAPDELYALRASQIGSEFGLNVIVRGSGREYRRLDAVRATGRAVIVPLDFPKVPDVRVAEAAVNVPLEKLLHWDLAPENPGRLDAAGVRIALTSFGLKERGQFLAAVRRAVKRGLSADAALRALTLTPAQLFGVADRVGSLERGKAAHLVVADGDLFAGDSRVLETWVDGRRYEEHNGDTPDLRGTWEATLTKPDGGLETFRLELTGKPEKLAGKALRPAGADKAEANESKTVKLDEAKAAEGRLQLRFSGDKLGIAGVLRISVSRSGDAGEDTWQGHVVWPDEAVSVAALRRVEPAPADDSDGSKAEADAAEKVETANKDDEKESSDEGKDGDDAAKAEPAQALFAPNFPLGEFGLTEPPPAPASVAFEHATVWTSGPAGTVDDATVLVQNGRIAAVGRDVAVPADAVRVDCRGQHVTPGIIDCHSHIATDGGVNESGQAVSAEVRIGDFVDCDDVNIYRQLAGGVTASNILHGSANPIGGQNQVLKLRWGAGPEEMKLAAAPPGIKFALGENVKQANWGDRFTTRYPQTRMGVDELIRDEFRAAQDYRRRWETWRKNPVGLPPRVDLELEAISEVVAGRRLIHCHSYRQDEILALLRNCADFGIRIATLQHILEGYKVADVMAKYGVGGSSFSDWWAYKYEVLDAIPYNGALMHNAGVVVSFNSDDAELARRLNLEAAKAVKYGGVSEDEALKFVTLNPAAQLGIAERTGSLEPGKDADLAVWSASPLSNYSRCEQTWVDGRRYFDRSEDAQRRTQAAARRASLVQRALASKLPVEGPSDGKVDEKTLWPRHDEFCGHGDHDHDHE